MLQLVSTKVKKLKLTHYAEQEKLHTEEKTPCGSV